MKYAIRVHSPISRRDLDKLLGVLSAATLLAQAMLSGSNGAVPPRVPPLATRRLRRISQAKARLLRRRGKR